MQKNKRQVKSSKDRRSQAETKQVKQRQVKSSRDKARQNRNGLHAIVPSHPVCDMLYRDLTWKVGTQRTMPESQSTWTKRVGAQPKTKHNY